MVDGAIVAVVALFAVGWSYAVQRAVAEDGTMLAVRALTANPFSASAPPQAAFVLDALVQALPTEALHGESGGVSVLVHEPGEPIALTLPPDIAEGVALEFRPVRNGQLDADAPGLPADSAGVLRAPSEPGIWALVAASAVPTLLRAGP